MDQEVEVTEVLKFMREHVGAVIQENAVLKATLAKLQENQANPQP